MKKLTYLILCSLLLNALTSCSSQDDSFINSVNPIEAIQQNTQVSSAKASTADSLIKQMVDKRFTFVDKNKDKKLIFSEFKGLESEHEDVMKQMFDSVDTDKNGIVTYSEFTKSDTAGIKSTLKQMFGMYDQNRNSLIDADELDMVVEIASEIAADSGKKITLEQIRKDYLGYDNNNDGKLSFDEYQSPEIKYMLMAPVDPYKN